MTSGPESEPKDPHFTNGGTEAREVQGRLRGSQAAKGEARPGALPSPLGSTQTRPGSGWRVWATVVPPPTSLARDTDARTCGELVPLMITSSLAAHPAWGPGECLCQSIFEYLPSQQEDAVRTLCPP